MQDLILHMGLCPGDTVAMTAAVRDLHLAHPDKFRTDVRTTAKELWDHNPYITPLKDDDPNVRRVEMHYDMIHQSNTGAVHFLHGFICHLERELGLRIPVTQFKGDIYLSDQEKRWTNQVAEPKIGWTRDFWIMMAGGKYDVTCKWWDPARYQAVVDFFEGKIQFVQCGEVGHRHPPLRGVINLVGKTTTRQFTRLMYHAVGVVCPITFAMHLAAAVPMKPGRSKNRPCVVVAGGREPLQWVAYPHHRVLAVNGALPCCDQGGCWKSKCETVQGWEQRSDTCRHPVTVSPTLAIPRCMDMIAVDDVCRAIDQYHCGGVCRYLDGS